MGIVLDLVWGTKVLLTGYNTYRLCFGEAGTPVMCGASAFYLTVLLTASLCTWKGFPTRKEITDQESDRLRLIEEGLSASTGNPKHD